MALPSRYSVNKKINSMEGLSAYENGGKGSGNFGHSGRPGEVGGSGKGTGVVKIADVLRKDKKYDLHGMSPETIVELMGQDSIHEDNLEDLQTYIDEAASEADWLLAEAKEEFGKKAKEASKKMGEELREKSPVRKQDEWFVTVSEIRDDYEKRSKEIEENADEVGEAISETGESYIGPKQKVVDYLASAIKIHADTYKDASDFLEQAEDLIDDYKYAKTAKSRKLEVSENPMSGSGLVVDEYWDD